MKIIFFTQYLTTLPAAYFLAYAMLPSRYSPAKTRWLLALGAVIQMAMQLAALHAPGKELMYFFQSSSWLVLALTFEFFYARKRTAATLFMILTCLSFFLSAEMLCGAAYVLTHLIWLNIVLRILFTLALCWFILHILRAPLLESIEEIPHGWPFFCLVPILFCATFYLTVQYPYPIYEHPLSILPLFALILLQYLTYFILFRFFITLRENFREKQDQERMEVYLRGMRNYELSIVNNFSQMAIYRHDLRHFQLVLMTYLKNDDIEGAMRELTCFTSLSAEPPVLYSKDRLLNSLFNHYIDLGKQQNINIHLQLALPEQLPCEHMDFAVTLSNAMENALNACEKQPPEQTREIWLRCEKQKNSLFFELKNTYTGTLLFDEFSGLPTSVSSEHGYGTRSIAIFGKKHNALPDFSSENGIFCLRLLIPYPCADPLKAP